MSLFFNNISEELKQKNQQEEVEEWERLSDLSEKELMVEMILNQKKIIKLLKLR